MTRDAIAKRYFEWLSEMVGGRRVSKELSYQKLLTHLHNTEFRWSIPRDENRAEEGMSLRYRYSYENGYSYDDILEAVDGECTVLEMIIALAIEGENIMDDPMVGDRTGQWFWNMIVNLGLGSMTDSKYDAETVDYILERFLDREYDPDGRGGLFRIKDSAHDLRDMEIWHQLCAYLNTIS